ncbi:MAG: ABC transporter permease [Armatimonadetes bacterium]|nr:ABC transporter permease [Armatimonadota bacterium]
MQSTPSAPPQPLTRVLVIGREFPALVLLLLLAVVLTLGSPAFRSPGNLLAVGFDTSVIGIMACGEAVVLIVGGIDLSIASILVLSAGGTALALVAGWPLPLALAAGLFLGATAGLLNGLLVSMLRLPPIVVTLATLGLYRAALTLMTNAQEIGPLAPPFTSMGFGLFPLAVLLLVTVGLSTFMTRSAPGRRLYALGGNEEACRVSGVPVRRLKPLAYGISGVCASVAGFLLAASSGAMQSKAALGYELDVIAACVIGGVSIRGGQGSIVGAVLGAMLLRLLNNALLLFNIPVDWYRMVIAGVLLLAAIGDRLAQRKAEAA